MRELKFRIWNCNDKKYLEDFFIDKDCIVYIPISYEYPYALLANVILEQYTGLKDKNGKEIYGGEIILCSYEGISYRRIVSYDADECCFGWNESGLTFSKQNENHFEIIGNICENQDLIDKKYEFKQISII